MCLTRLISLVHSHTHAHTRYYKVLVLSSWTPSLCFIKNDVMQYFLYLKIYVYFFYISVPIEASSRKDSLQVMVI